ELAKPENIAINALAASEPVAPLAKTMQDQVKAALVGHFEKIAGLQARFRMNDPAAVRPMANFLAEQAGAYFAAMGIHHAITYEPRAGHLKIVFSPNGTHPVNRLAKDISEKHGGTLVWFDPAYLIRTGAAAAYSQSGPQLLVGRSFVLNLSLREVELIHELRHSKDFQNELKRILSPYYGRALAQKGDLPGQGAQTYDRYIAFTEMNAYFESVRIQLAKLKRAIREGDPDTIDRTATRLQKLTLQGWIVSQRSLAIAEAIERHLGTGAEIPLTEANGMIHVAMKIVNGPESEFIVTFPLVHSKGLNDPDNPTYWRGQLALLKLAADRHWTQFDVTLRAIELLQIRENKPFFPAILEALGRTITHTNWQRRIPGPVPVAQMIETFNSNLKKAIEIPQ
ncbi:MAG TPA: hypothetical protein VFV50_10130, partial [Bdellovibrionales bacterium]|nr:hypothetical protein [Bdellovibrionales bacterium]